MVSKNLYLALRKASGLTRSQLAELSGVSAPYIQLLERDEGANPSLKTLNALGNVLGFEVEIVLPAADWDALAAHGAPLLAAPSPRLVRPSSSTLLRHLLAACRELDQRQSPIRDRERKLLAVQALCWAVQTEFPTFFRRRLSRSPLIRKFAPDAPSGRLIKLRRQAAARLAEYL